MIYITKGVDVFWISSKSERRPLLLYTNKAKLSGLWSAELIIAVNTPKTSRLSPAFF